MNNLIKLEDIQIYMYVQYIFIRKKERKRNAKQRKRERKGEREGEREKERVF